MKFLDEVQVIRDCDEYKEYGVYAGMIGTIMDAEIRDNCFHVIFVDDLPKTPGFEFTEENMRKIKEDIFCPIKIKDLKFLKDGNCSDEWILDAIPCHNPLWWCKVEDGFIKNLNGDIKNKIPYDYDS